jgi:hypothetical protein
MLIRSAHLIGVLGIISAVTLTGCSTPADQVSSAPASATATALPTATPEPTADLSTYLLTIDDLPTGGWSQSLEDSSEPPTSQDQASTDPCEGDLSAAVNIAGTDSPPTVIFERRGATVSQSVLPANSDVAVSQIRDAVEPCFGKQTEVTVDGQTAMVEFTPVAVPDTLPGAFAFDFTRTVSIVSATVHFLVFPAGDYTQTIFGVGSASEAIDEGELQGFAIAAIAKAHG